MFLSHNFMLQDQLDQAQKKLDAGAPDDSTLPLPPVNGDVTPEQSKMLEHYWENITFPAPASLCMAHAAAVVLDTRSLSAAAELSGARVPMDSLTTLGKLQLMVTDAREAFPRFGELTGGREIGALRVVGYSEDGMLSLTPRASSQRLLVAEGPAQKGGTSAIGLSYRRYVFIKEITGEWVLPASSATQTLVLAAEAAFSPHLDAMEGTREVIRGVVEHSKPVVDATGAAAGSFLDGAGATWEATRENVGRGLEAVGPVWAATQENVGKGLEATTAAMAGTTEQIGKGLQAANEAMAPAVAPVLEPFGKGLEATGAAVAPVWAATQSATAPLVEASAQAGESTRNLCAPFHSTWPPCVHPSPSRNLGTCTLTRHAGTHLHAGSQACQQVSLPRSRIC